MTCKDVKIDIGNAVQARLSLYIQDNDIEMYGERKRPLVLVCPGGAYEFVCCREGEPIALQFLTAGCHAAVLWYDISVQGVAHPQELLELAQATAYIREHAEEYMIDKDKIIVAGFSAGGHLAASLGCFWHTDWLAQATGMKKEAYQPNGLVLAYPVITSGEFAHRGSFVNLMGANASQELEEQLSLEKQVTENMPPVFMWHTFEDDAVPLENSLMFAVALRKAGVNFEYHVFPHGGHGYALATKETAGKDMIEIEPQCEQWMPLCKNWLKYNYNV